MKKIKDNIHSKAFIDGIIVTKGNKEIIYNKHDDSLKENSYTPLNQIIFSIPIIRGNIKVFHNLHLGFKSFNLTLLEIERRLKEVEIKENDISSFEKEQKILEKLKINLIQLISFMGIVLGIIFAFLLFIAVPSIITTFFTELISNSIILNLIEGMLRIIIFIGFLYFLRTVPEIKTLYMYHAAEHKILNSQDLTSYNDLKSASVYYWNCASVQFFKLTLCIIVFFSFVEMNHIFIIEVLLRILAVPIILGILYELKIIFDEDKEITFLDKIIQKIILVEPTDDILYSVAKVTMELKERR